jgi:hypothetical protein
MFRSLVVTLLLLVPIPALAAMSAAERTTLQLQAAVGRTKNLCAEFKNADGTYSDDPTNPNPRWSPTLLTSCPAADAADKAISAGSSPK